MFSLRQGTLTRLSKTSKYNKKPTTVKRLVEKYETHLMSVVSLATMGELPIDAPSRF